MDFIKLFADYFTIYVRSELSRIIRKHLDYSH